jgi:hypothetical protein
MKRAIPLPQSMADEHTLIAQRYAGHFVRHSFRAAQQRVGPDAIRVDRSTPWKEPAVVADGCEFCQHLTDDDAVRRVAGYQHAIDIEVLRPYAGRFADWLASGSPDLPEVEEILIGQVVHRRGVLNSAANRRAFIEANGHLFEHNSLPMVRLPLRLKRKLCIEWNHLYVRWLQETPGAWYDFTAREFYRDVAADTPAMTDHAKDWWVQAG